MEKMGGLAFQKVAKTDNNLKRDPLEIQHPTFENSRLGFIESSLGIMVDVTSFTLPSPGLSATLLSNKC